MGKKENRIKYKSDILLEELSIRWINGEYRHLITEFKSNKQISRRHPKIENLYDFRYVNLRKTRLSEFEIDDVCLDNSNAFQTIFASCNFKNSEINNVDFDKTVMRNVKFLNCKIEDCKFQNSDFFNVQIKNCILTKCNFSNSKIVNLDISDSVIDDADLSYIQNYDEMNIFGKPKSMKGVIIDRLTFMNLKNDEVKELILKDGIIIDNTSKEQYDLALSFAGENRDYVEQVAQYLKNQGIKVFYDDFEKASLWGKELIGYLTELYSKNAKYVIIFVSKYYNNKAWPNVERIATLSKIFKGEYDFILPVMLDNTIIIGLTNSKGYLDGQKMSPKEIADCFCQKFINEFNI